MKTYILKIGGSVLTVKSASQAKLRQILTTHIGEALGHAYDPKKMRLILIHGVGSFGHLHAHTHGLAQGTKSALKKLPRTLENNTLNQSLSARLAKIFQEKRLPVASINTASVAINRKGRLETLSIDAIENALGIGAIPMLHGDMIFDSDWGMSVCSGDTLIPFLAKKFDVEKIFFASDVDGIFSCDPHKFKHAQFIKETSLNDLLSGKSITLAGSHHTDVTDGFRGKFGVFQNHSFPHLKKIHIFNGLDPTNFENVFKASFSLGTKISIDSQKK
ncbi:MAG: hypothetical protein KA034_00305 [Candidatus Moranbacteria bacterium]|jgi:isopentenyl phosphate kinase|nr:hypothetical protein [Candidatus Moranbacteria bacterium]MDQ5961132.1 isopentenyl phosphate kinase [Patescibacteria group bacterium]